MIQKTTVDLGSRSYDILIGENIIDKAGIHIGPLLNRAKTLIITDENVAALHLAALQLSLTEAGLTSEALSLPAGETTKGWEQLERSIDWLLSQKVERGDIVVAFGGGVIGDLGGFAASVLRRGVRFVQLPTSLLAQVDSSVGGKTGINAPHGKNLIGAFHQPQLVLIDVTTLDTLEPRHVVAGYAEIVKYGLINDIEFFEWLEKNGETLISGPADLRGIIRTEAILRSCEAKAAVVAADEKETGVRALLNLGHTFGHALEAENGYNDNLFHGEAVAMGMILAFQLSEKMDLCPAEDVKRISQHFKQTSAQQISTFDFDVEHLLLHMQGDKKMSGGKLTFVLASGIGKSFLNNNVEMDDVRSVLKKALER